MVFWRCDIAVWRSAKASKWAAVKEGSGPWPASQSAKRCFLNCLETSFKLQTSNLPFACLPSSPSTLALIVSCLWLMVMSSLTRSPLPSAGSADMCLVLSVIILYYIYIYIYIFIYLVYLICDIWHIYMWYMICDVRLNVPERCKSSHAFHRNFSPLCTEQHFQNFIYGM